MRVTVSPCAPDKKSSRLVEGKSPLLEIAQMMSDDCGGNVCIEVLDIDGRVEAVIGQNDNAFDIELF